MPAFEDSESLVAAIQNDIFDAIEQASLKIVEILKRNIRDIVYDPWTQYVRKYKRRYEEGGFLGSWSYTMDSTDTSIFSTIASDPDLILPPNQDDFFFNDQGGDVFVRELGISDRRDIMDEAIARGWYWDFYVPEDAPNAYPKGIENWWTRPRDYWSPTIAEVEKKKVIDQTIGEFFKSQKINFTKRKI
jgi:hypothetical protein